MASTFSRLDLRSSASANQDGTSRWRALGLGLGVAGMMVVGIAVVAGIVAGNEVGEGSTAQTRAWAFGVNTLGLSFLKLGIGLTLAGILIRLWQRVDSVKAALPTLKGVGTKEPINEGVLETAYGPATLSREEPTPLFIHRMAHTMWLPSLVVGAMAVVAGFIVALVQAGEVATDPATATQLSAWVQGLQFLGEGFLLSGIAFLLGTILGSLRKGGAEVQRSADVGVQTLEMPVTAKLFVGLMMLGLMVEVFQFIAYAVVSSFDDPVSIASYFAWLGPVRELGLGLILAGIVLALATIGKVLAFQFHRIANIIATGK